MENIERELTPEESLALISNMITAAKRRFHDNGIAYVYFGCCLALASLAQYGLLAAGYYKINYYPYFIMPLAGTFMHIYYRRKRSQTKGDNIVGSMIGAIGFLVGINIMLLCFGFWNRMGEAQFAIIIIFLAIVSILVGIALRFSLFTVAGIVANVIGFVAFFIPMIFHPLLLSLVSIVTFVIPGIVLNVTRTKQNV